MEIPVTARDREYIPIWQGNRDNAKPIRATLHYFNTAQRMQLMPWRPDEKGRARMEPDVPKLLTAGIERLDDCVVIQDGERREIRDGHDLLASFGLEGLALEFATELIRMNARGDVEKNS